MNKSNKRRMWDIIIYSLLAMSILFAIWAGIRYNKGNNQNTQNTQTNNIVQDTLKQVDTIPTVYIEKVHATQGVINNTDSSSQYLHLKAKKGMDEYMMAHFDEYFHFRNNTAEEIMTDISRDYNIDVEYIGKKSNRKYTITIYRRAKMQNIINELNKIGMPIKIEGHKVIVGEK